MLRDEVLKLDPGRVALWDFLRSGSLERGDTIRIGGASYSMLTGGSASCGLGTANLFLYHSPDINRNYSTLDEVVRDPALLDALDPDPDKPSIRNRVAITYNYWHAFFDAVKGLPGGFSAVELDRLQSAGYMVPFLQQLALSGRMGTPELEARQGVWPLAYHSHSSDSIIFSPRYSSLVQLYAGQRTVSDIHGLSRIIFGSSDAEQWRRLYVRNHQEFMAYLGVGCLDAAPGPRLFSGGCLPGMAFFAAITAIGIAASSGFLLGRGPAAPAATPVPVAEEPAATPAAVIPPTTLTPTLYIPSVLNGTSSGTAYVPVIVSGRPD